MVEIRPEKSLKVFDEENDSEFFEVNILLFYYET